MNANVLHRWLKEHHRSGYHQLAAHDRATDPGPSSLQAAFIPVQLPSAMAQPGAQEIKVELRKGALSMALTWPLSAAAEVESWSAAMQLIRIDAAWQATAPLDMRAGTDTALARVVAVFGAAHPHTAYLFANKRANRIKILVHDGIGVWLAAAGCIRASSYGLRSRAATAAWSAPNSTPWCSGCPGSAWAKPASLPWSESSRLTHALCNWGIFR
jgi:hypothetical protein